jgi:hypothetical protein
VNSIGFARREHPFALLRRMAQNRGSNVEQCEFCSVPLEAGHRHLLEIAKRKIICSCNGCALRFDNVIGRYKLVPRDTRRLDHFQISDVTWAALSLPIELAFFFHSTAAAKIVAMYPSPAGATESLLPLANWEALVVDNPVLSQMQPDVETLLVNRLRNAREYFIAPIDVAFELVGLIRLHWRGFSGGDHVWQELDRFFSRLRQDSGSAGGMRVEAAHA